MFTISFYKLFKWVLTIWVISSNWKPRISWLNFDDCWQSIWFEKLSYYLLLPFVLFLVMWKHVLFIKQWEVLDIHFRRWIIMSMLIWLINIFTWLRRNFPKIIIEEIRLSWIFSLFAVFYILQIELFLRDVWWVWIIFEKIRTCLCEAYRRENFPRFDCLLSWCFDYFFVYIDLGV